MVESEKILKLEQREKVNENWRIGNGKIDRWKMRTGKLRNGRLKAKFKNEYGR